MQAATEGLQGLQTEASKAKATAERLQQMVASLTADNLVFVMRLKKTERELLAVTADRDELRLEAEEQRGPWFDEVLLTCSEPMTHARLWLLLCCGLMGFATVHKLPNTCQSCNLVCKFARMQQ